MRPEAISVSLQIRYTQIASGRAQPACVFLQNLCQTHIYRRIHAHADKPRKRVACSRVLPVPLTHTHTLSHTHIQTNSHMHMQASLGTRAACLRVLPVTHTHIQAHTHTCRQA